MCIETLEHRTLMSSSGYSNNVWLTNGILGIQGSSSTGTDLTANLVNNGKSISASADKGHVMVVPLSAVKQIHITGGSGNDVVFVDQNIKLPVTILGGNGNDQIRGGGGYNTIIEGNGNNWVTGRGWSNYITAGDGNNTLLGAAGNDTLIAGNGYDSLDGAGGNDILTAGNGNDSLTGDAGNDTLTAGSGKDIVNGGLGDDRLIVGNGPSIVIPGSGTNYISLAGSGPTVIASAGKNTIVRSGGSTPPPVAPPVTTPPQSTNPVANPTSNPSAPSGGLAKAALSSTTWFGIAATAGSGSGPHAVLQVMDPAPYVGIAVITRAVESSLGAGTPIDANYQWNFGDYSSPYNYLPGFNASHIYTTAGTYTISLTVTNELHQSSTVSCSVTIQGDNPQRNLCQREHGQ